MTSSPTSSTAASAATARRVRGAPPAWAADRLLATAPAAYRALCMHAHAYCKVFDRGAPCHLQLPTYVCAYPRPHLGSYLPVTPPLACPLGPKASEPGYASVCEAFGGLRHINGYADRPPVRPNISLGDTLAGLHAAFGAVMALLHRQRCAVAPLLGAARTAHTAWVAHCAACCAACAGMPGRAAARTPRPPTKQCTCRTPNRV